MINPRASNRMRMVMVVKVVFCTLPLSAALPGRFASISRGHSAPVESVGEGGHGEGGQFLPNSPRQSGRTDAPREHFPVRPFPESLAGVVSVFSFACQLRRKRGAFLARELMNHPVTDASHRRSGLLLGYNGRVCRRHEQ